MSADRPEWADALANALVGLAKQAPRPLLTAVSFFAGTKVGWEEVVDFLRHIDPNDRALTELRLALARWDQASAEPWLENAPAAARQPRSAGRRGWVLSQLALTGEVVELVNQIAPVYEDHSTVISKEFEPWYRTARTTRSQMYWTDYETYLRGKRWEPEAIAALDETTTDVLERLSDPTRPEARQTKGLVVGYVQSGKTANFTGVAAKAIDAGYRMVIVLTGTIELLRAQTQRRLDMELVGRENIVAGQDLTDPQVLKELDYQQDEDWLAERFIEHGHGLSQLGVAHIRRVTTHRSDYRRLPQGLTQLRFIRMDRSKPFNDPANLFNTDAYIAVIKKNKSPLSKLIRDLRPLQKTIEDLPILIIDDESDQASVDTTNPRRWGSPSAADRKRTVINGLISQLLDLCPRAQYVGYTATPFANVFIDPDDERDIFPANFLLSLRRPPGYMGVADFHDLGRTWQDEEPTVENSNQLAHVRKLEGDPLLDPAKRDDELTEALDAFVLSGVIKLYRQAVSGRSFKHHTMLVHESVRQNDHRETADAVRRLWVRAAYGTARSVRRLTKLWDADFSPVCAARNAGEAVPPAFDDLIPFLGQAVALITTDSDPVIVINSDKDIQQNQKKLDFDAERVWRILVGGSQLSRGFTVQDLTISYFRRKSLQADTLMQAGRWFGFRPGYRDLVRLYIRSDTKVDLYGAFEALLMDEEAFRDELGRFEGLDEDGRPQLEPWQIPPLVSQHLPWLRPTARSKMWNAVIDQKGVGGRASDLYNVPTQEDVDNKVHNFEAVGLPLLHATTREVSLLGDGGRPFRARMGALAASDLVKLLARNEGIRWHPDYEKHFEPIRRSLEIRTAAGKITDWVVVWPQVSRHPFARLDQFEYEVPVVQRTRRSGSGRTDFVGSDSKHRYAVERIAGLQPPGAPDDPVVDELRSPTRGGLLVYLVDDRPLDEEGRVGELTEPGALVVLMSIAEPAASVPAAGGIIRWATNRRPQLQGVASVPRLPPP